MNLFDFSKNPLKKPALLVNSNTTKPNIIKSDSNNDLKNLYNLNNKVWAPKLIPFMEKQENGSEIIYLFRNVGISLDQIISKKLDHFSFFEVLQLPKKIIIAIM